MIRKITEKDYDEVLNLMNQIYELHYEHRPDVFNNRNYFTEPYFEWILNREGSLNVVYEEDDKIVGVMLA